MFKRLIFFAIILSSCAQVGTINGGPEDQNAPKIKNSKPPNGTKNLTESLIILEFDEFISLKNPVSSVSISPPDARIELKNKGKELEISLIGNLQENTTYAISFNNTISDFTVGNDTLFQYVFATGDYIDSISYTTKIIDAFTLKPIENAVLGLYLVGDEAKKPLYFGSSDKQGAVNITYIKPGTYIARAFEDKNGDLLIQKTEKSGFLSDNLLLDSSKIDSSALRISTENEAPKIQTFNFKNPSLFTISANASLRNADIKLNGSNISNEQRIYYSNDSLSFLKNTLDLDLIKVEVFDSLWSDSLVFKIDASKRKQQLTVDYNFYNSTLLPDESLQIMASDRYAEVNKEKIRIFNPVDSTFRNIDSIVYNENTMHLYFDRNQLRDVELIIDSDAYKTENQRSADSTRIKFKVKTEKDYGILKLELPSEFENVIVELLINGKVYRKIDNKGEQVLMIKNIDPESYTLRIIIDENNNNKWDAGNFQLKKQAESVQYYDEPIKIRANWDLEIKLD